jgi:hypothetical protein
MQPLYSRLAPDLLAILELVLMAGAAMLILFAQQRNSPRKKFPGFRTLEDAFRRLANHRNWAVVAVGAAVLVIRVALIPLLGVPEPRFHDEFSYLLAADTFAHGRLTNPTHPMWIHFETFHVIQHPTYMSMYPPAQGLVLAAGQLLGQPWIGQLLATGAMCSALCWMLQAWLPPSWALLGAVLAALRLGILSYWMNSFWCASVPALGGALVLGAWPRLRQRPSVGLSATLTLGLLILANSRPYEGFVFSIPIAAAMLAWLAGHRRPPLRQSLPRVVIPVVAVLLLGGLATGLYYHRVTGSAFTMTYQVNRAQYSAAPYFIWQRARTEPEYHSAVMRDYYQRELGDFQRSQTVRGYIEQGAAKLVAWWQFYLGPLLSLPLLALPWVLRDHRMGLPLAIVAAMALASAVQVWTLPHYFSPAVGALYILLIQGLRHLWQWRRHAGGAGRAMVRAVPLLASAMILLRVVAVTTHTAIEPAWPRGNLKRAQVEEELARQPGRQLAIVHYGSHHDLDLEWVWNAASIDASKVVWARDMGEQNEELLNYFKDRRAWLVNADDTNPHPEPYAAETARFAQIQ